MAQHSELENLISLSRAFVQEAAARPYPEYRRPETPAVYVVNRQGEKVRVLFDNITLRNEDLCLNEAYGPPLLGVDTTLVTTDVIRRFRNGITTRELDAETAGVCAQRATRHNDYEWLAARIHVSDLHKRTPPGLEAMVEALANAAPDRASLRLSDELLGIIHRAGPIIDAYLKDERDFRFRYFGFQTLSGSYLLQPGRRSKISSLLGDQPMERPQHLYMRVALGVFVCRPGRDGHLVSDAELAEALVDAFEFYDALSLQRLSNATPTMLNAGTTVPQLSSCFLVAPGDDLRSLYETLTAVALISQTSGGVAIWLHGVRAEGATIRKTGGVSSGLKRYIKNLNETQEYVNQGGNRPGAFAVYLSPDHADIFSFLINARPIGDPALDPVRAAKLQYALWVPDLFMEAVLAQIENEARVAAGGVNDPTAGDWHLFCPDASPDLHLYYGEEYRALYNRYVAEGRFRQRVKAGEVIQEAFKTWTLRGNPYVGFKDAANKKSNLRHIAPICSSNLCHEILIPSWSNFDAPSFGRFHPDNAEGGEYAVCNLAAICLESFLIEVDPSAAEGDDPHYLRASQAEGATVVLDYEGIIAAAGLEARALNKVIDLNTYPSPECERSNHRHRPIGIGIMGLADVLARLRLAYGSPEALAVARAIAACVYYGAMDASATLAETEGSFRTFPGSPTSEGKLQPDLWVEAGDLEADWEEVVARNAPPLTPEKWNALRGRVSRGVRNCYVTAYMPTATTSNVAGQNECFEPFTSNVYTRKTGAGEFTIVNRHLLAELSTLGLWDEPTRLEVIAAGGSIQGIIRIPEEVRRRYKTAREIHPSLFIRTAKALAPFIDQTLSLNMYLDSPDLPKILRFLVEGWREGLKTGVYYVHTRPAGGATTRPAPLEAPHPVGSGDHAPIPGPEPVVAPADDGESCPIGCVSCGV